MDMTCQPLTCDCGRAYYREGAFLLCPVGHSRMIEAVGCPDHPRNGEWEAYLDAGGRESFEQAVQRHIQSRRRWS